VEGKDENEESKLNQASRVWSEFSDGVGGVWDVGLNTTGFLHILLLQEYARAYHKAAKRVFEGFRQTLQDGEWFKNHRDTDAHPIVFSYRQALELYLKTVLVWGERLQWLRGRHAKAGQQTLGGHDLANLLPGVKEAFGLIDCSSIWIAPTYQSFADIERVVRAVNEFSHDAFRYPVDRAGSKELLPGGVRFNVLLFAEKLDGLLDLLERVATRIWDTFQKQGLSKLDLRRSLRG
jgi:hypothetical protein